MKAFAGIASEWNDRYAMPLSALHPFLPLISNSDIVLDAGCGNARNAVEIATKAKTVYGIDSSREMLSFAKKNAEKRKVRNVYFRQSGISSLPFKASFFDKALCLAVLHHLKTGNERLAALKELRRVLKPSGLLFLSVWNRHQKKFGGRAANTFVDWPSKERCKTRIFYHFYEKKELEELAVKAGFAIKESFYELKGERHRKEGAANMCMILRK